MVRWRCLTSILQPFGFQRRCLPILCGVAVGLYLTAWQESDGQSIARSSHKRVPLPPAATGSKDVRILSLPVLSTPRRTTTTDTVTKQKEERWVKAQAPMAVKAAVKRLPVEAEAEDLRCVVKGRARKEGAVDDSSKEANVEDCQRRCRCLEACDVFTFWQDGSCHVQSNASEPFSNPLAISGPASCSPSASQRLPPPLDLPPRRNEAAPGALSAQPSRPGEVGPKVYVYDLPSRFRNWGKETPCGWDVDCIFGGPPVRVHGVDIWASGQFHMPMMLYYRFRHYPRLTRDVDEADVFIIPAYNFRPDPELPCANNSDLYGTLYKLNPKLKDAKWAKEKAPRHLLMDGRGWEVCSYMWQLSMPFRLFHRINIELNGLNEEGPEGWTFDKPFVWYQFPYPAMYHGPSWSNPAVLRLATPVASTRYLWAFSGTGRGQAGHLRHLLMRECTRCNRCGKATKVTEIVGSPEGQQTSEYARLAAVKLQSLFCAEPPGDSVTRKSLIDSIVLGCIPVIFVHQELYMFEALFASLEEWADAIIFVPEVEVVGAEGQLSEFGRGTFHEKSEKWRQLQRLYPRSAEVFEALRPRQSKETRENRIRALFPKPRSLTSLLNTISEEEIQRKRQALAKIAQRFVIGIDDSSEDAVRVLLNQIVSDDALAAERNRQSPLEVPTAEHSWMVS